MTTAASLGIRKGVPPVTASVAAGTAMLSEGNALPRLEYNFCGFKKAQRRKQQMLPQSHTVLPQTSVKHSDGTELGRRLGSHCCHGTDHKHLLFQPS